MKGDDVVESVEPEGLVGADSRGSAVRRILVFFATFTIWGAIWWSPLAWLLDPVIPGGWPVVALAGLLGMMPVLVLIHAFQTRRPPPVVARVWLVRPFWYVQLLLPFVSVITVLGILLGLPFGQAGTFGRTALALAAALALVVIVVGFWGAHRTVLRHLEVLHPRLPAALDGLRVVQLSDLHIGAHTSPRQVEHIRTAVRLAEPDLIVLTGDQVDDHGTDVAAVVAALEGLRAPLGIVAVPGNHDVYVDWHAVREGMQAAGYTVLVNQALPFVHNDHPFWVAGTGDPAGAHLRGAGAVTAPNLDATVRHVPPDAFVLGLAHNPALWPGLVARGVHVTLSGHTHHGQVSIPRLNWSLASLFLRYAMGHHVDGDAFLYINPGTHYWGIPLRLGAWPEVTQVILRSGDAPAPHVVRDEVVPVPRTRSRA